MKLKTKDEKKKQEIKKTENVMELRVFACEFRAADTDDDKIKFEGHAAVFNVAQDMHGLYEETIKPGAFTNAIKEDDVRALFNHDPNYVLGRNTAGTLKLAEDNTGLAVEIDAPDTQQARDINLSVKRKDLDQMSFAFIVKKEEWDWDSEPIKRTILEVKLYDVSIVTYAAYPQTDVSARAFDMAKKEKEKKDAEADKTVEVDKNLLELRKRQQENLKEDE